MKNPNLQFLKDKKQSLGHASPRFASLRLMASVESDVVMRVTELSGKEFQAIQRQVLHPGCHS